MLNNLGHLGRCTVTATDGQIGTVKEAFFDDQKWTIRYLVVDTGKWLSRREVLISPYSVKQPLGSADNIDVSLTTQQVVDSPDIDTHLPVSRRQERAYLSYYEYPEYWGGDALWAMSPVPLMPPPVPDVVQEADQSMPGPPRDPDAGVPPEDVHLRSSANVTGYDIQASDDSIGHVKDFVFDDESWAIRYLVVDTRNWWPGGKKVLVATHWVDRIDWGEMKVHCSLTREQIRNGPEYHEGAPLNRDYEKRLHDAYGRQGYWD